MPAGSPPPSFPDLFSNFLSYNDLRLLPHLVGGHEVSFQGSAHHPSYVHPPAHTAHSPYHILVLLTRCSKGIHTKAIEECIFPNLMPHMMDCMNLWKQRVKVPTSRGEHFRGKACVNLQKGHALCVDKKALIPVQKQWCTIEKGQCGIQSPCCLFAAMQGPPLEHEDPSEAQQATSSM